MMPNIKKKKMVRRGKRKQYRIIAILLAFITLFTTIGTSSFNVLAATKERILGTYGNETQINYDLSDISRKTSDESGRITYTYNELGQLAMQTDADGNTLNFTYDAFGNVTKVEGLSVSENYTYDEFGRLKSAKNGQDEGVTYSYDTLSRVKDALYTNGIKITYSYDSCGRVSEQVTVGPDGEILSSYTYTYGKNGEILTAMENYTLDGVVVQTTVQYTYGKSGMLLCETHTQGENVLRQTYTYDAAGNRIGKETSITGDVSRIANQPVSAGVTTYTYNELNQLITETFTENAGTADETVKKTTYTYDAAGNLVKTSGEKEAEYTYNARNQLIKAKVTENGTSKEETYGYDAQGVRSWKRNSTGETNYITYTIGGLSYLFAERNENGELTASYLRGYGLVGETLYHNNSGEEETFFYLLDGNSDVRALADEAGSVTDTYRFDAFGIKLIQTGNTKNPYGYRSEETDELTGFVYLRARYMNPATGTFISEDTFGGVLSSPITLNRYAYAGQNPVSFVDPSGHFFTVIQQVVTMTLQEMINNPEETLSLGRFGAFLGGMEAIISGDSNLEWAITKGFAKGVATAFLGKLKEVGMGIKATKQLYMVHMLAFSFANYTASYIYALEKEYPKAAVCGAFGVMGMFEFASEYGALQAMDTFGEKPTYDVITNTTEEGGSGVNNPLENIEYTDKVLKQMQQGDYHAFPDSVTAFGDMANSERIIGGDGIARMKYEIAGSYDGKNGVFQYIIEPDGYTCNHRIFVPSQ